MKDIKTMFKKVLHYISMVFILNCCAIQAI